MHKKAELASLSASRLRSTTPQNGGFRRAFRLVPISCGTKLRGATSSLHGVNHRGKHEDQIQHGRYEGHTQQQRRHGTSTHLCLLFLWQWCEQICNKLVHVYLSLIFIGTLSNKTINIHTANKFLVRLHGEYNILVKLCGNTT